MPGARPGGRVDQDDGLVAVQERVSQVEPSDAEVDDTRPFGQVDGCQAPGDLDAEGVVAQEDVADAGDQDRGGFMIPPVGGRGRRPPSSSSFSLIVPPRAVTGRIR